MKKYLYLYLYLYLYFDNVFDPIPVTHITMYIACITNYLLSIYYRVISILLDVYLCNNEDTVTS